MAQRKARVKFFNDRLVKRLLSLKTLLETLLSRISDSSSLFTTSTTSHTNPPTPKLFSRYCGSNTKAPCWQNLAAVLGRAAKPSSRGSAALHSAGVRLSADAQPLLKPTHEPMSMQWPTERWKLQTPGERESLLICGSILEVGPKGAGPEARNERERLVPQPAATKSSATAVARHRATQQAHPEEEPAGAPAQES